MEVELARQVDAGEIGLAAAIFAVAQDRRAHGHAMGPQLMSAPGDGHHTEPSHAAARLLDHAVIGDGAPALLIGLNLLAVATALLGEGQIDAAFRALVMPDRQGPVHLARLLMPVVDDEHFGGGVTAPHLHDAGAISIST